MKVIRVFILCVMFAIVSSAVAIETAAPVEQLGPDNEWPQWMGPRRDGVWREEGVLEKFPEGGPKVRWRTPVGAGYSGPAVAGGKVFITDRLLADGVKNPDDPFKRGSIAGFERVLCLNEADGKILWQHKYDCAYTVSYASGPRTTPVVSGGKVYTLGTEGHLLCLDAKDGKLLWERLLTKDYGVESPMWGFSSHLLLDGPRVIATVGGVGQTVVAFDKDSGKEVWKAVSSPQPGYSAPVMINAGGTRQLIVWTPAALCSLNPETGKEYWSEKFEIKMGMNISMPRHADDLLLVSSFFNGSMMMRLDPAKPAATLLWRIGGKNENKTEGLHSVMATPFIERGHIYGVCSYGQLRCLEATSGKRVWETFAATGGAEARWGHAFIIKNGDRYFLPNELGDLIIAKMSPKGYEEISRAHLLAPTNKAQARDVVWSHPAFANKSIYARNDKEIVCVSLARE
jgi:outer membrane protein assembly factor BamB